MQPTVTSTRRRGGGVPFTFSPYRLWASTLALLILIAMVCNNHCNTVGGGESGGFGGAVVHVEAVAVVDKGTSNSKKASNDKEDLSATTDSSSGDSAEKSNKVEKSKKAPSASSSSKGKRKAKKILRSASATNNHQPADKSDTTSSEGNEKVLTKAKVDGEADKKEKKGTKQSEKMRKMEKAASEDAEEPKDEKEDVVKVPPAVAAKDAGGESNPSSCLAPEPRSKAPERIAVKISDLANSTTDVEMAESPAEGGNTTNATKAAAEKANATSAGEHGSTNSTPSSASLLSPKERIHTPSTEDVVNPNEQPSLIAAEEAMLHAIEEVDNANKRQQHQKFISMSKRNSNKRNAATASADEAVNPSAKPADTTKCATCGSSGQNGTEANAIAAAMKKSTPTSAVPIYPPDFHENRDAAVEPPQCPHFNDLSSEVKARILQNRLSMLSRIHRTRIQQAVDANKETERKLLLQRDEILGKIPKFWATTLRALPNNKIYSIPYSQQLSAVNTFESPEDRAARTRVWRAMAVDDEKIFQKHLIGVRCNRFYPYRELAKMKEALAAKKKAFIETGGRSSGGSGSSGASTARAVAGSSEGGKLKGTLSLADITAEEEILIAAMRHLQPSEEHYNITFMFSEGALEIREAERRWRRAEAEKKNSENNNSTTSSSMFAPTTIPVNYNDVSLTRAVPTTDDPTTSYPHTTAQDRNTSLPKFFPFYQKTLTKYIAIASAKRSSRRFGDSAASQMQRETIVRQHSKSIGADGIDHDFDHGDDDDHSSILLGEGGRDTTKSPSLSSSLSPTAEGEAAGTTSDTYQPSTIDVDNRNNYNAYHAMGRTEMDRFDVEEWKREAEAEKGAVVEAMAEIDAAIEAEEAEMRKEEGAAGTDADIDSNDGDGEVSDNADDLASPKTAAETDDDDNEAATFSSKKGKATTKKTTTSIAQSSSSKRKKKASKSRKERLADLLVVKRAERTKARLNRRIAKQFEVNEKLRRHKEHRLSELEKSWARRAIDNHRHEFGVGTTLDWGSQFIGVERDDAIPYLTGMNWFVEGYPKGDTHFQVTARRKIASRSLPVAGSFFSFFQPAENYNHYSDADRASIKLRLYGLISDVCGPLTIRPLDVYETFLVEEAYRLEREREEQLEAQALAEMAIERLATEARLIQEMGIDPRQLHKTPGGVGDEL